MYEHVGKRQWQQKSTVFCSLDLLVIFSDRTLCLIFSNLILPQLTWLCLRLPGLPVFDGKAE